MGQGNAKADLENYRKGYPDLRDDLSINDNYLFYSGQIASVPDGEHVDNVHANWWGNTDKLEMHHGYIQWLFPIKEHGMNHLSKPLQSHEIDKIKADPECIKRFILSYEMMLHFYGCRITDPTTGELERHEGWKDQYWNLNTHTHNFLRITRILKCLGELGFEHYKKSFLEHFIKEIWINRELTSCAQSCENYWIGTIKNDNDRKQLEEKVASLNLQNMTSEPPIVLQPINMLKKKTTVNESRSSTSSDDEWKNDEAGRQELKQKILAQSEDFHSSHDDGDDDDAASDDGNLDLVCQTPSKEDVTETLYLTN